MTLDSNSLFKNIRNELWVKSHDSWLEQFLPAVEEDVEDERVDDDDEVEEGEGEATRWARIGPPVCDAPKGRNNVYGVQQKFDSKVAWARRPC